MSHQYQPTAYYDWPARAHGDHLNLGIYAPVSYDYYQGDEIYTQTTAFKHNGQVTFDGTNIKIVNNTSLGLFDTSSLRISDGGTLAMHTSAGRTFSVDPHGRVGIGMDHGNTIESAINTPDFDLNVRGTVGVESFIYHNDDTDTYMLFGSDTTYHPLNTSGNVLSASGDLDEINFRVGGVDMLQMRTRDTIVSASTEHVVSFYSKGIVGSMDPNGADWGIDNVKIKQTGTATEYPLTYKDSFVQDTIPGEKGYFATVVIPEELHHCLSDVSGCDFTVTYNMIIPGHAEDGSANSRTFSVAASVNPQDHVTVNKYQSDVDLIVRSATCSGAIVSRGDGSEVVINEDGVDTNFRVESTASDDATPDPGFTHLAHDKEHALFVDGTNGRVGLGTSSPNTTLHVAGSAHIEGDLWIKGVTNQIDTMVHVTSAMDITNTGTGPALEVKQTGSQPVAAFYDDTLPALYIEDGGNVGIGTNDPTVNLEVRGTTALPPSFLISQDTPGDGIKFTADTTSGYLNTITHNDTGLVFDSNAVSQIRPYVFLNGRVGIGVSPTSPLHISDTGTSHDSTSLYATLRIDHNHGHGGVVINSTDNKQSHLGFAKDGDTRWRARVPWHDTSGDHDTLRFYSYTHGNDVMTLSPSGTVGIGIDFPVVSLNVDSTDALRVPVGNVAQRPAQEAFGIDPADTLGDGTGGTTNAASMLGMIRYNTENSTFEGFGPGYTWGSLGGVIDVDRDTYWTAVNDLDNIHVDEFDLDGASNFDPYNTYPGDTDYLRAFTSGLKRFAIADTGDVRFYKQTSGPPPAGTNYGYTTYLEISHETAANKHGAVIESASGDITLKSKSGASLVNIDGHNGSNHGLALAGTLVKATAAELNIMDGGTTATSTAVSDADRVVYNDNGTMKQVAVTNLTAYFDHKITTMPNLTSIGGTNKAVTVKDTLTVGTMGALEPGDPDANPAVPASPILNTAFVLNVGGNIRADGDIVAYATSDERLKDNKTPIADPLSKISVLTGYEFDWNEHAEFKGHDVGVIAQEVEKVLPEIVTTRESGYKAVKYEKIVPLLIECVKDQQKQINELKELIARD